MSNVVENRREIAISVIVPVYNMESKLATALDSALSQTLNNIEVICVDDGSTDNSLKALGAYAEKDRRVVVIAQENAGPGLARNSGMFAAKGEYLFFLDPDDWIASNTALESLYSAVKEAGLLMAGGNLVRYSEGGRSWGLDRLRMFSERRVMRLSETEDCFGYTRYIFDRSTLLDNGVMFPSYRRGQDPVFMTRVMGVIDSFQAITEPVYSYCCGFSHVRWTKEKAREHYSAFRDVLDFSARHQYAYMHSAAASRVFNRELLLFSFIQADSLSDSVLVAQKSAVGKIERSLLSNRDAYDSFIARLNVYRSFLSDGQLKNRKKLKRLLNTEKCRLYARGQLATLAKTIAPTFADSYQHKHTVPVGSYDGNSREGAASMPLTNRGGVVYDLASCFNSAAICVLPTFYEAA